jgi:hypothetical protein
MNKLSLSDLEEEGSFLKEVIFCLSLFKKGIQQRKGGGAC